MTKSAIIIGCGDIGRRFAALAQAAGFNPIFGTYRSEDTAAKLSAQGIQPYPLILDAPGNSTALPTANATILYCVPPPGGGFHDSRARNFCHLLSLAPKPARIVYLSTTAVYGNHGDNWITEQTEPAPNTSRGHRRLDAETAFTQFSHQNHVPLIILRVAGIYGPDRLPLQQLLSGHPVLSPAEAKPTNRIHADDLAAVCLTAAEHGATGAIYNVCDGHPTSITDYFTSAAALLSLPAPRQISMDEADKVMTPLMLTYVREGHLISNQKMITELKISLRYPTLIDGLPSCMPPDWTPPDEE